MIDFKYLNQHFFSIPKPSANKHWVKEYDAITLHTQRKSPGKLISKRRPTESQETYEYRIQNYEHITHGPFNNAIETLQEILTEANASLHAPDNLMEYVNQLKIGQLNFWQWCNSKVARRMINDANGILVWWPIGDGVIDSNSSVEVKPILIRSGDLRHFTSELISWKSEETTNLTLGNNQKYKGEVYYSIDDTNFYKYKQVAAGGVNKYKLEVYYPHKMGRIPYIILGGEEISETENGKEFNFLTSYFAGAIPFANEAIKNYSDHQASVITSAHAIIELESIDCQHRGCDGGRIQEAGVPVHERKICPSCKGTGQVQPLSPYGKLYRPKRKTFDGENVVKDAMKIHQANPANLEYQEKHWRNWMDDCRKALNILKYEDNQSGKAKEYDLEGKRAMIDKIGFNFFNNIIKQSFEIIGALRFINQSFEITLTLPQTLKPKSEKELAEELTMLKEKGAPSFLVQLATTKLIQKRYATDKVALKMSEFLIANDPLFPYTPHEIGAMVGMGAASVEDSNLNAMAPSILTGIVLELGEPAFLDMPFDAIKKRFDKVLTTKRPVPSTLFNNNGEEE